ncbi:hypothetical protein HNY73_003583 [Argiope bruennichi]|uniref:Uncharacterized protein n=1 Tax=Argiope bruennichi TaxID=94029 RepID=A0A8T0FL30_ARGBR|nr:hypothetical protein HNY73_003583 [Argiope bruennichi]
MVVVGKGVEGHRQQDYLMAYIGHDSLTVDDVVLQEQAEGDECEVQEEHDERQSDVHLPLEAGDGNDDE